VTGTVRVQRNERFATFVLDNVAKRNSLDLPMLRELAAAAHEAARDPDLSLVILRGAGGKAFCAGADFDAMTAPPLTQTVAAMEQGLQDAIVALMELPMPLIAAIDGACFGGGVQVALAADIRIASAGSKFGIPAAQIGLAYPFDAIAQIVGLAGSGVANLLLLTGEAFDADTALRRRLIDEVVAAEALEQRLDKMMMMIVANPPAAATAYKRLVRALALSDQTRARQIHADLAALQLHLPKLEAIQAQRSARARPIELDRGGR
jgi:enoyl-CoA hydratase